ncbi:unnamed protein product [Clavelina lepadiformis]|uniref:Uncharacterized protein n=1 Tax=Clavelina lepadiformis TaxID=159417 RepID=A0ABP0FGG3_CLALP
MSSYVPYNSNVATTSYSEVDEQSRQYELLEQLQILVHKLPMSLQQRLSHSLLSDIAAALLDRAIFTIVGDLEEIQHLTEKNLYTQRQKLLVDQKGLKQELRIKQREEIQTCRPHNLNVMKQQHEKQKSDLEKRLQTEVLRMDERILHELDQKVTGQQATLQSAGVPGFFVTDKQEEIKLQMAILQLIKDIARA